MTDKEEKRRILARYRIRQAGESLDEANYLHSGNKSPRSVINRAYYAMFYAVLALLVHEPYSSSRHSGVLSYFNRRFIKEGILDKELGRALNRAFELRQRGDYREYVELSDAEVAPFIKSAEEFISNGNESKMQVNTSSYLCRCLLGPSSRKYDDDHSVGAAFQPVIPWERLSSRD
ncbi:MAG: HEPN domain-containing protein [Syntrophobacteria bacterium]